MLPNYLLLLSDISFVLFDLFLHLLHLVLLLLQDVSVAPDFRFQKTDFCVLFGKFFSDVKVFVLVPLLFFFFLCVSCENPLLRLVWCRQRRAQYDHRLVRQSVLFKQAYLPDFFLNLIPKIVQLIAIIALWLVKNVHIFIILYLKLADWLICGSTHQRGPDVDRA